MKIWGEYNTINSNDLNELSEYEVWLMIKKLNNIIYLCSHDENYLNEVSLSKEDLQNARYNLEYLVYFTRKFGVTFDYKPNESYMVKRSDSYLKWFERMNIYHEELQIKHTEEFIRKNTCEDQKEVNKDIKPKIKVFVKTEALVPLEA